MLKSIEIKKMRPCVREFMKNKSDNNNHLNFIHSYLFHTNRATDVNEIYRDLNLLIDFEKASSLPLRQRLIKRKLIKNLLQTNLN
jgi:hypothetical protein